MDDLIEYYSTAKKFILSTEYKYEYEWCEKRPPFEQTDSSTFFKEYVYVVLNAGMREQVARKIFNRFIHSNHDFSIIGHKGKREAIKVACGDYTTWYKDLKCIEDDRARIEYLKKLPWIGDITKYHLARNIGIDTVKPDRHLVRLAEQFGFKTPMDMCLKIQESTHERLGVIDVILWRSCNLKVNYQKVNGK